MTGTISKLVADKGFGFIKGKDGKEYFFHKTAFDGHFDDLIVDISSGRFAKVEFEVTQSVKGPRAENVRLIIPT